MCSFAELTVAKLEAHKYDVGYRMSHLIDQVFLLCVFILHLSFSKLLCTQFA